MKIFIVSMLAVLEITASHARAMSLGEQGRRTSPSNDIFRRFHEHFPIINGTSATGGNAIANAMSEYKPQIPSRCRQIDATNTAFLGEIDPATGKAVFEEASPAFMTWYYSCIMAYARAEQASIDFKKTDGIKYFGADGIALLHPLIDQKAGDTFFDKAKAEKWAALSVTLQKIIEQNILNSFIGPGVLDNEDVFKTQVFDSVVKDDNNLSLGDALKIMIVSVMSQEEFLNF